MERLPSLNIFSYCLSLIESGSSSPKETNGTIGTTVILFCVLIFCVKLFTTLPLLILLLSPRTLEFALTFELELTLFLIL